jgi:PAS domain S-box-containing protein
VTASSGVLARWCAGFTGAVGLAILAGWTFEVGSLRNGVVGDVAVNLIGAIVLVLAAVSIWASSREEAAPFIRRLGLACGAAVVVIALIRLAVPIAGLSPAAIEVVSGTRWGKGLGSAAPKPVTGGSAILYVMLGAGLLLITARRDGWRMLARSIGLFLGLIGALALFIALARRADGADDGTTSGLIFVVAFLAMAIGLIVTGPTKPTHDPDDAGGLALRRRVNLAIAVAVSIIFLTGGVTIWSTSRSQSADRQREASWLRRTQLSFLLSSLQDASLGETELLVTGNKPSLRRYQTALDTLPAVFRRTVELFDQSAPQRRWLDSLRPEAEKTIELHRDAFRLNQEGRGIEALALVRSGRAQAGGDEVRRRIELIIAAEDSLGARLKAVVRRDSGISITAGLLAALLAVCFLLLAGLAINADLRKRAEAETALRQNEARLAQIVDLMPAMVFLKEPAEHRFVRLNRAGEQILGRSRESMLGKTVFELFPKEIAEGYAAEDRAVLGSQEVLDIPEETVYTEDMGTRILHTKKIAVRDEHGRALFLLGVSEDITERKQLEEERDRFFTLSLDMLCIARSDGYFKRLNPAFTQTLGWSIEEMLARPFLDFVHPDDRPATLREVERQTVAGEEVLHFENRYLHKNGSWRTLSWKSVPHQGGFMYATARDVTELREAEAVLRQSKEAAESANRAKSDFLAKMSHELRTPLNSIIGFSEILEDESAGALNEKQRRYVGNVLLSGRNLLQLINDILDLAKVEAGRMELSISDFDPRAALEQVRTILTALADKKGLTVQVSAPDGLPPLSADQPKFKQIMYNLVGNAIKFTGDGGRVDIGARVVHPSGNGSGVELLEVSVADTGIGISAADLQRIFGEFEQVASDVGRSQEGTGLGLALTRKLVELHGGRVWVESELGRGSVFRFTIPYPGRRAKVVAPARVEAEAPITPGGPLILIIDNDPGARDLIDVFLEESGYSTAWAENGADAVRLAQSLSPAAITLDILLPDRDGLLILAQLKSNPVTRNIPVVVVSVTDRRELGFSLGATDWLVKPVNRAALGAALERMVPPRGPAGKPTILVVDDEVPTLEYLTELIQGRGFEVACASGGRAGVDIALDTQPDLILLDLMMPDLNGFDVVSILRAHPKGEHIPIVILTAKDLTVEDAERLRHSVQAVIPKGGKERLLAELARICPAAALAGDLPAKDRP